MFDPSIVLGKYVVIGENVQIGKGSKIGNHVTIFDGTTIGEDVVIMDGAILGRPPISTKTIARKISSTLSPLTVGSHSVIGCHTVLYKGSQIGDSVLIGDLVSIREECTIHDEVIIGRGVTINYHTVVGKKTKIMDLTHLTGNMIVEDNVFISMGVLSANDNEIIRSHGESSYSESKVIGPYIKSHASIGLGAVLLPGVIIGFKATVAAGAVVTKNVEDNTFVLGVPARLRN